MSEINDKGFIYGLDALKFKGKTLGYLQKDSFDFGGTPPESIDINAEQVPEGPVFSILQSNGTIKPAFELIQLRYENLKAVMGGKLKEKDGKIVGWAPPRGATSIVGSFDIVTATGQKITITEGKVAAHLNGGLNRNGVASVKVEVTVLIPEDEDAEPFSIEDE